MEDIKYHPLINDGSPDLVPMFVTTDKAAVANNKFYLEEIIPHYYRFISKDKIFNADAAKYEIHCPYCGKVMHLVASPTDLNKHALYACKDCSRKLNTNFKEEIYHG